MEDRPVPEKTAGTAGAAPGPSDGGFPATRRSAVIFTAAVPVIAVVMRFATPFVIWLMSMSIPRCLMDRIGLRCPLCGGTRCAAALARGDIAKAVYYNPYVMAALVYLLIWYVRVAISCFGRDYRRARPYGRIDRFAWVVLVVTLLFTVLRNLPFYRAVFY